MFYDPLEEDDLVWASRGQASPMAWPATIIETNRNNVTRAHKNVTLDTGDYPSALDRERCLVSENALSFDSIAVANSRLEMWWLRSILKQSLRLSTQDVRTAIMSTQSLRSRSPRPTNRCLVYGAEKATTSDRGDRRWHQIGFWAPPYGAGDEVTTIDSSFTFFCLAWTDHCTCLQSVFGR
jgi:hypothetical protein